MSELARLKKWDFDTWMHLAQQDPERFEALRAEAIERVIDSVTEDRKIHLRRLQWRIDQVRDRSKNPMAATVAISRMMWDSFQDLRDRYHGKFGADSCAQQPDPAGRQAKVLDFPPRP